MLLGFVDDRSDRANWRMNGRAELPTGGERRRSGAMATLLAVCSTHAHAVDHLLDRARPRDRSHDRRLVAQRKVFVEVRSGDWHTADARQPVLVDQ